jgi:hypothetical protein
LSDRLSSSERDEDGALAVLEHQRWPRTSEGSTMSMIDPGARVTTRTAGAEYDAGGYDSGSGWLLFAAIMISIAGVLNVIWGIAAIGNSSFFVDDTRYILSNLNTWGWVTLIVGFLQLLACVSIVRGGQFGRWFGIIVASLSLIAALLSIPAYPFWSLAIFAVDIMIIYGLAAYGGQRQTA